MRDEKNEMDDLKSKEKDILFSKAIKAGKRIYYLDVKKDRKNELFLAITESKKIVSGNDDKKITQFEKHKIFLYREDFDKFMDALNETLGFIREQTLNDPEEEVLDAEIGTEEFSEEPFSLNDEEDIKLDIDDFEP